MAIEPSSLLLGALLGSGATWATFHFIGMRIKRRVQDERVKAQMEAEAAPKAFYNAQGVVCATNGSDFEVSVAGGVLVSKNAKPEPLRVYLKTPDGVIPGIGTLVNVTLGILSATITQRIEKHG